MFALIKVLLAKIKHLQAGCAIDYDARNADGDEYANFLK